MFSYKKVGPLHFLAIGSLRVNWCVKTRPVTKRFTGNKNTIVIRGRNLAVSEG